MSNKTIKQRITDLRGKLLGVEMELHIAERDIDELKDNIAFLEQIQSDLNYNVNLHKKPGIISIAKEYQKTVWQLGVVDKTLKKHKAEISNLEIKMEKKELMHKKLMMEFEATYKAFEEEEKVLVFKPRR